MIEKYLKLGIMNENIVLFNNRLGIKKIQIKGISKYLEIIKIYD